MTEQSPQPNQIPTPLEIQQARQNREAESFAVETQNTTSTEPAEETLVQPTELESSREKQGLGARIRKLGQRAVELYDDGMLKFAGADKVGEAVENVLSSWENDPSQEELNKQHDKQKAELKELKKEHRRDTLRALGKTAYYVAMHIPVVNIITENARESSISKRVDRTIAAKNGYRGFMNRGTFIDRIREYRGQRDQENQKARIKRQARKTHTDTLKQSLR